MVSNKYIFGTQTVLIL